MPQSHIAHVGDFLLSIRALAFAGQDLQDALAQGDADARDFAIAELEQAYTRYDQASEGYRAFMLGRLGTTRSPVQAERVSIDALGSVVADLQVAHVLLAAGQSIGELETPTALTRSMDAPSPLAEALQSLNNTARDLRQALAMPISQPVVATRGLFGSPQPVVIEPVQSPSFEQALDTFRSTAMDTLEHMVDGVHKAIRSCIEAISGLDEKAILSALEMLVGELGALPEVGRLVRLAVDRLKKAITAILTFLGDEVMDALKAKLKELVQQWLSARQIDIELRKVLNIQATQKFIEEVSARPDLSGDRLDRASTAIKVLRARFDGHVETIGQASKTVAVVGGLLVTSGLGVKAVLLAAVAYLAIIAWAVGMGIDYTDSGRILNRVQGIGTIARELI
jgi:tetrahydromethanopterin S-methyltransferase subunit A